MSTTTPQATILDVLEHEIALLRRATERDDRTAMAVAAATASQLVATLQRDVDPHREMAPTLYMSNGRYFLRSDKPAG